MLTSSITVGGRAVNITLPKLQKRMIIMIWLIDILSVFSFSAMKAFKMPTCLSIRTSPNGWRGRPEAASVFALLVIPSVVLWRRCLLWTSSYVDGRLTVWWHSAAPELVSKPSSLSTKNWICTISLCVLPIDLTLCRVFLCQIGALSTWWRILLWALGPILLTAIPSGAIQNPTITPCKMRWKVVIVSCNMALLRMLSPLLLRVSHMNQTCKSWRSMWPCYGETSPQWLEVLWSWRSTWPRCDKTSLNGLKACLRLSKR